jgi:D-inositol-3-phosphate glycosyltransferase
MAEASVTAVPSRDEAFGLVALESIAVGTPVVASRVGGLAEIVRDGIDGFLVPPDDPKALAEKLAVLLSNRELRDQIGRNARQRFLDTFEQSKVVQEQANWFERIVAEAVQRG